MNVASVAVPGLLSPGATKATFVARSGAAAGWFVAASMNENTNRYGPTTCSPRITGSTDGADGLGVAGVAHVHAATRRGAAAASRGDPPKGGWGKPGAEAPGAPRAGNAPRTPPPRPPPKGVP